MKRSSILISIAIVSISIIMLLIITKMGGQSFHEGIGERQSWHGIARHTKQEYPRLTEPNYSETTGLNAVWLVLLRMMLLVSGALLFLKAKGTLRWSGAILTALGTWSLLGPIWGSLVLLVVFLLYKRMTNENLYNSPQPVDVFSLPIDTHDSRGRFLDEWERKQQK